MHKWVFPVLEYSQISAYMFPQAQPHTYPKICTRIGQCNEIVDINIYSHWNTIMSWGFTGFIEATHTSWTCQAHKLKNEGEVEGRIFFFSPAKVRMRVKLFSTMDIMSERHNWVTGSSSFSNCSESVTDRLTLTCTTTTHPVEPDARREHIIMLMQGLIVQLDSQATHHQIPWHV